MSPCQILSHICKSRVPAIRVHSRPRRDARAKCTWCKLMGNVVPNVLNDCSRDSEIAGLFVLFFGIPSRAKHGEALCGGNAIGIFQLVAVLEKVVFAILV